MTEIPHIVFFSRGKGRGHAIPDAAIATAMLCAEPNVKITFISYNMGAETLDLLGWHPIDLRLPEDNPLWDTVIRIFNILSELRPTLVISHEEFAAIPISKALGIRNVFLTDWFIHPDALAMQALRYADEVVFLDDEGYQDVPSYLAEKIFYVGPVLRQFQTGLHDKQACREVLGIPRHAPVIAVIPGGAKFHSETSSPILDLVLAAFDLLENPDKRLIWVVGDPDYPAVLQKSESYPGVTVMKPHAEIIRTMRAADVVITKGNRISVLECEALKVPSISISFGNNPIDDNRVARVRTNMALRGRGLNKHLLKDCILKALSAACSEDSVEIAADDRPLAAAKRLLSHLNGIPSAGDPSRRWAT